MLQSQYILLPTLKLRPHWIQFFLNNFGVILLVLLCLIVAIFGTFEYHKVIYIPALGLGFYTLAQLIYMLRLEYVITTQQIIIRHGVITYSTDYVELYRVVDYQQSRSFWQQLFGLKNVTIHSGDRTNPIVVIIGVKEEVDIVSEIRNRVEFNKRRRGIYEFTNQQ